MRVNQYAVGVENVPLPTMIHLDADAFFVSVELAKRPELRGKRVAVGGRQRGIISSASYEARAVGVYTPMPSQRALKVCPDLVLLPHSGDYGEVSRRMFDLCESLTPLVQRNSIDEGYLDLAPCGLTSLAKIEATVRGLQGLIWDELQIPVSMGIASNRLISQIASKLRKPRGFVVVPVGEEAEFLAPLDIGVMPGIGKVTEPAMKARGISVVGDVLARSDSELAAIFGDGWRGFRDLCLGIDPREIRPDRDAAKSYSQQQTFRENIDNVGEIVTVTKGMLDHLMPKIRRDGVRVRTLTLIVRYGDFSQESAGRSLPEASDLETSFYPLIEPLLTKAWHQRRALRLVSVKLSGVDDSPAQLEIFGETNDRRRALAGLMDRLNAGQGGEVLTRAHRLTGGKSRKPKLRRNTDPPN